MQVRWNLDLSPCLSQRIGLIICYDCFYYIWSKVIKLKCPTLSLCLVELCTISSPIDTPLKGITNSSRSSSHYLKDREFFLKDGKWKKSTWKKRHKQPFNVLETPTPAKAESALHSHSIYFRQGSSPWTRPPELMQHIKCTSHAKLNQKMSSYAEHTLQPTANGTFSLNLCFQSRG